MVCGLFMLLLMLTMPLAAPNSIALKRCTGAQECQRRTKGMTWKSNYLTLKTQTPDGHNPNTTLAARSLPRRSCYQVADEANWGFFNDSKFDDYRYSCSSCTNLVYTSFEGGELYPDVIQYGTYPPTSLYY